jgi:urea transport system substrate-binding protein
LRLITNMNKMALVWLVCWASLAGSTPANSAEPIRIGAVLPFSGGVEPYGKPAKLGLDLAVKEINDGGGVLGRPQGRL